ncbi:MAG: efflux transporter outer membrane subunit [Gammaproteobacteria bacterium]|nr:efflux transporter outer membrane subunit [Gammaproteobacteria bacterium]
MKIDIFKFIMTAMLSSMLLSACMLGPNYHQPKEDMPTHFIDTKKTSIKNSQNKNWWKSVSDPILISLINKALEQNLDIQQAQAKIHQSRAELNITSADLYPELDASGKLVRDHLSANSELISAIPTQIPLTYTDTNIRFDASWELDFFGHTRRSIEASKANLERSIENTNDIALTVTAEVAKDYIQYRTYQQRIIIAEETIASYQKTEKLVKLQFHAGYATSIDVQRLESQVFSAQAAVPPLQAEARASLAALAVMIGESPESLYERMKKYSHIPVIKSDHVASLPSDLLQRRPDIRMADRDLAAATANIGVAIANQFPRFKLVGDVGYDSVFSGSLFHAASRYWTYGPQIYFPIFQGGRLKNAVKESKAARDAIFANYKKTILQALADVESSMIRFNKERKRNQRLLSAYKKIKSTVKLINLQYVDGKTSLLDVLDVERQANVSHDEYVQSLGLVSINQVALYKALGGGIYQN